VPGWPDFSLREEPAGLERAPSRVEKLLWAREIGADRIDREARVGPVGDHLSSSPEVQLHAAVGSPALALRDEVSQASSGGVAVRIECANQSSQASLTAFSAPSRLAAFLAAPPSR
jgi:hypothetical protein